MQIVTMTYKGKSYKLGSILPVYSESRQQYIIIPNFPFRPPFICLRLLHAHRRMELLALEYLRDGGKIDNTEMKLISLEPTHDLGRFL